MSKRLPKAERVTIAAHEAGRHDPPTGKYPGLGYQDDCRLCHIERDAKAGAPYVDPEPIVAKARKAAARAQAARVNVKPTPAEAVIIAAEASAYRTREEWMLAAIENMRPWLAEVDAPVGPVRISFGWPGGRGSKKGVRGQCWMPHTVKDQVPAIFVSPDQEAEDAVTLLGIILHEMNHAAGHWGHKGPFAKTAARLGFVAPWTSSEGKEPELVGRLEALSKKLGPLDHAAINAAGGLKGIGIVPGLAGPPPVQSTRMIKVWCNADGYTLRATRKWLDIAVPACPMCSDVMEVDA